MSDVQNTTEEAAPAIGLVDLQNAIKIIDHACEQGAFKGWQVIEQVIQVRTKLSKFVDAALAKQEAEKAALEAAAEAEKPAKKTARKVTKK